jgi:5-methylcytosine-specific restriction endonuclease McrA
MKPSSAKSRTYSAEVFTDTSGLRYRRYRDKDNVSRRAYIEECIDCGVEKFAQKSLLKRSPRCRYCANKTPVSKETKEKISETLRLKYLNDSDYKRRVALTRQIPTGDKHWNWKGGVTPINQRSRTSKDYSSWRLAVFSRDNYKCRVCNSTKDIQAHHINSWSEFPEDRFVLENGLTLCKECHEFYHKYEKEVRNNCKFTEAKRQIAPTMD